MQKVIIDFDNTMGIEGCDLDDGLALLYLLGCQNIEVVGACTTYGNSNLAAVHQNTLALFKSWGLNIPVYKGTDGPKGAEGVTCAPSEAARFIAQQTCARPGEIALLATGSTTNLLDAAKQDQRALDNAKSITLMGGITESLVINGKIMNELNFSCDPAATLAAISASCPVNIATAQNCMPAFFTQAEIAQAFGKDSWAYKITQYWFADMLAAFGWDGWVCWDVVAAAHLANPQLFDSHQTQITLNQRLLSAGFLETASAGAPQTTVNMPTIKDPQEFKRHVLEKWETGMRKCGLI